ncbi:MAG TPA: permease-like cell division protein FtsX [Saprospiraceae bacterium]|nr:permease-like cell division protein FtsX [Saprospiraceae bacterium]
MQNYRIQHPGFYLLTLFSLTILLMLSGFFLAASYLSQRYANKFQEEVKLIVELKTGADKDDQATVTAALKKAEGVLDESVEFISKEKALEEMRSEMSDDLVLEEMENPFTDMLRFSVDADHFNEESIDALKENIESLDAVREMHHPAGMYDPVFTLLHRAQAIGAAIILVLLFLCATLIHHVMRLNVLSQRKQIRTMQLVGGHPSFIRKPFLAKASQMAILSWLIAVLFCLALLFAFAGLTYTELSVLYITTGAAILLALSFGVCMASTWVAVTKVLGQG